MLEIQKNNSYHEILSHSEQRPELSWYKILSNAQRFIMKQLLLFTTLLTLISCGQDIPSTKRKIELKFSGETSIIVTGAQETKILKEEARRLGLKVLGDEILRIKGDARIIEKLEFKAAEDFDYIQDTQVEASLPPSEIPQQELLYLAKKDFGLLEFWKKNPLSDGRGVKVGVIDDGISPHQEGFITTTEGRRKFLKKTSQSSFTTFKLTPHQEGFEAVIDEKRPFYDDPTDLNGDGKSEQWVVKVNQELTRACIEDICKGAFSETGDYFLLKDQRLALFFEIDKVKKEIKFFQPEKGTDSHGEGVASVMAGNDIGGLPDFDGVAPGAQILDYDLSEVTDKPSEREYTLGTFLTAIEWLGKEGAEVTNVSYSLFFTNTRTQAFMNKALDKIIKKYNMVISFSAGNNGPGLGSLNRRAIYPSSALVAGAFISKELDEVVHGVTGVPDEGRVVYYSSRGPGLGVGPLLISPLSSLTNSSPERGHGAFSGTSSASPALAGVAAVLVSAIKQEGLLVDASTVVSALKLSGKRLRNEPFIFQGYGLPQIETALSIYRELMLGKRFMDVRVSTDADRTDGVPASGIFLKTSETKGLVSRRVSLTGILSPLSSGVSRVNLLAPVTITYSSGISGARNLWVSSSVSSFYIDIDPELVLKNNLEGFGEIRIHSQGNNALLTVIPVTVVHDQNVLSRPKESFTLTSQQGLRFPLFVPEGVNGFRIRTTLERGEKRNIVVSAFNSDFIRTVQQRMGNDIWVPVTKSGFHQVGIAMAGGTIRDAEVTVSIETLSVRLRTKTARSKDGVLTFQNLGTPLSSIIRLTPLSELIQRVLVNSKDLSNGALIERDLTQGEYNLEMRPVTDFDLSFNYFTCSTQDLPIEGTPKLISVNTFKVSEKGSKISLRCMPFDLGAEFEEHLDWELLLWRTGKPINLRLDVGEDQTVSLRLTDVPPMTYKVELVDPLGGAGVDIGTVDIY